jgi:hypothetical protein
MTMGQEDPIIRASELAQYAYCARAWWLGRVKGYQSANVKALEHGTARHHAHGRVVASYHRLRWLALALLGLAVALLFAWLLLSLAGL